MNEQIYISYIIKKLTVLICEIKLRGKLNLHDINIHSEDFFCQLLNKIYGTEYKNTNEFKSNTEAIDLIEKNIKEIIQVTSNNTKKKIESTLNKKSLKKYSTEGYQLKFIILKDSNGSLRTKDYSNPYKVKFNPKEDILYPENVIEIIKGLEIEKKFEIYNFFQEQFDEDIRIKNFTNLAEIMNILSNKNLTLVEKQDIDLRKYKIEEKIEYNKLERIKDSTINKYKEYIGQLDKIYKEFDIQGLNKSISIFNKLGNFYEKEIVIDSNVSSVQIFFNIIKNISEYIKSSSNYIEISDEELEQCVRIIVVDAFIRCKVFEKKKEKKGNVITS